MLEIFPSVIGFIFQLLEKVKSHYYPFLLPSRPTERNAGSIGDKEKERMKLQMNYVFSLKLALLPGAPLQTCFLRKAPHPPARASLPMVILSSPPQAHFTEMESDRQGDLLLWGSWEGNTKHYIKHRHQASSFGLH